MWVCIRVWTCWTCSYPSVYLNHNKTICCFRYFIAILQVWHHVFWYTLENLAEKIEIQVTTAFTLLATNTVKNVCVRVCVCVRVYIYVCGFVCMCGMWPCLHGMIFSDLLLWQSSPDQKYIINIIVLFTPNYCAFCAQSSQQQPCRKVCRTWEEFARVSRSMTS
jgi:hypothetical protein